MALSVLGVNISANAQERTAAGAVDTQMTWTALSGIAKAASDRADAVNSRMDQVVICGKKNMIYALGMDGADTQGCVLAKIDPTFVSMVNNIIACANEGKTYSSATNTCISVAGKRWYTAGAVGGTSNNDKYSSSTGNNAIRAGYPVHCGGTQGMYGRLCTGSVDRCYIKTTSESCSPRGGESNDHCTTSHGATLHACE